MSINKNIGKRIREIRNRKGITSEKMAEKLNISYSTYLRIESGETTSWATYLEKISETLEVPIEEIILERERYIQIIKEQSTGYSGDIVINNLSEKVIELYEIRLKEKNEIIKNLQKSLDKFK